jgi:D-glycero-alpha-D-manno-heptose-7-phosphate kinase
MIISRTPYRISFLGGGTDYPAWYRRHGGAVLGATIDKYCYLTCRYLPPFFEHRFRVVYSRIEDCHTVDDVQHPAVREVLRYLNICRGLEIHHDGDLPARSGVGSSSSFTVGLLHALHALQGQMTSKHQLAMEGIHVEQERLHETVGSQDQVLAAYGGVNHVSFLTTGEIAVHPVTVSRERVQQLNQHLMLFYTGIKRTASDIAQTFVADIDGRKRQLRIMRDLVDEGVSILNSTKDIGLFGELLHESWQLKRTLSPQVSNDAVEALYRRAQSAGAVGGKLLGAGGGGFLLLFVSPEDQPRVRQTLSELIHVPFEFEFSGTQIIFFDPEKDYTRAEEDRAGRAIEAFRESSDELHRSAAPEEAS